MASVAKRYSDALFLAAESAGAVDAVEADMALLGIALAEQDLRRVLADPKRSAAEKKGVLVKLLTAEYGGAAEGEEGGGPQKREAHAVTLRFLDVVFDKARALELPRIAPAFHTRVLESRGEIEGRVVSFSELSDEELSGLAESLGSQVGAKVRLTQSVDPELLGGLRVFVGDRMFDASLQGQLDTLGRRLRGAPLPTSHG